MFDTVIYKHIGVGYTADLPQAFSLHFENESARKAFLLTKGTGTQADPYICSIVVFMDAARCFEKSGSNNGHLAFTAVQMFLMNNMPALLGSALSVLLLSTWMGDDTYDDCNDHGEHAECNCRTCARNDSISAMQVRGLGRSY